MHAENGIKCNFNPGERLNMNYLSILLYMNEKNLNFPPNNLIQESHFKSAYFFMASGEY